MTVLLLKEKVLELLQMKGPQLPVHLAAQLKINLTFAGAFLSELIADGKVKYTSLKVGGSPLYYVPGQEIRLQSFSKHLGEREKDAYDILVQQKLMKDDDLSPVLRVAMRSLKDFAIPLRVTTEKDSAIYWRWYLLPDEEMNQLFEEKLGARKEELQLPAAPVSAPEQQQTSLLQVLQQENQDAHIEQKKKKIEKQLKKKELRQQKTDFVDVLFAYFKAKGITILSHTAGKKSKEIACLIAVPTPLGEVGYFCLALDKSRCTDADVSAGYVKAAAQQLPYLFLSREELPKKVQEFVTMHMPKAFVRTLSDGNKNL